MAKLSEQVLLEFRCRLEELVTQREGMVAENAQQSFLGHGIAYGYNNFQAVAEHIAQIASDLILLGEG